MLMAQYMAKDAELVICFLVEPVMLLPRTDMMTV